MMTRRQSLLSMVAGGAGFTLSAKLAVAFHYEDMPPDLEPTLNAACRAAGDSHSSLIAAGRQDLLGRIARGLLPAGAGETVACPVCGCSVVVSADDAP